MKKFKIGDDVILISKTPGFCGYSKLTIGEIYTISNISRNHTIMLTVNDTFYLDTKNFMTIDEYRESKLKLLLDI